ncbi:hypothetical protein PRIPAC_79988 [Pristionchus pacificus]|uniref:Uncharacterized protein n=1 Tax=Pristionchus pacificus TaxID=54126 RepID=A0A2A6BY98_PRIPA|nr:hypothetical protein PRIPAC_79988 [Pristionchus pacificus]|eukprot:PDM70743.1 hypothetical protein PRIPAC_44947 [Pristionchus pacificus]
MSERGSFWYYKRVEYSIESIIGKMLFSLLPLFCLVSSHTEPIPCPDENGYTTTNQYYTFACNNGTVDVVGCTSRMSSDVIPLNTTGVFIEDENFKVSIDCFPETPVYTKEKKKAGCVSSNFTFIPIDGSIVEDGQVHDCKCKQKQCSNNDVNTPTEIITHPLNTCVLGTHAFEENTVKSLGSASTGYFNFRCVKDTDGPDYASKKVFAGCTFGDKTVEPGESYVANGKSKTCELESSSSDTKAPIASLKTTKAPIPTMPTVNTNTTVAPRLM